MQLDAPDISDEAQRAAIEIAISDCVQRFYAKGLADPLLGPIFSAIPDLPAHLEIIKNFWSRSLLGTERSTGCEFLGLLKFVPRPLINKFFLSLLLRSS